MVVGGLVHQLTDSGADDGPVVVDRAITGIHAPVFAGDGVEEISGVGVGEETRLVLIEPNTDITVSGIRRSGRSGTRPEEGDSTGCDRYQQRSYSHT